MPTPLQRAEKDLAQALSQLQSTLTKQTRNNITALIPLDNVSRTTADVQNTEATVSGTTGSIDQDARQLEEAVDKLITAEEDRMDRAGKESVWSGDRVKELVRKWYRAMYPFLDLVLKVGQSLSQISVLNPYGVVAGALIMLNQFAYDQSGRRSEIDEMMKDLSIPLRRIQLEKVVKTKKSDADGEEDPALTAVKVAGLNVLTCIVETLVFDIHYLSDNAVGKAIASAKPKEADLRMKLKAASDHYTDAMVDLGLAKTLQLSEVVEAGFERLETQVRRGLVGGLGNAVDPLDSWLSKYADLNAKERNKHLSLQTTSSPDWIYSRPEFTTWLSLPPPLPTDPNMSTSSPAAAARNIYLTGTTGYGKSCLAAYLTTSLLKHVQKCKMSYFFVKEGQLNIVDQILRCIVYQLCAQDGGCYERVKGVWGENRGIQDGTLTTGEVVRLLIGACLDTDEEMQEDLKEESDGSETAAKETDTNPDDDTLSSPNTVFLILDALNEPSKSSQSEIHTLIHALSTFSQLRIIITSQPTEELHSALRGWTHLELQPSFPEKTIEGYVNKELEGEEGKVLREWFAKAGVEPLEFFGGGEGSKGMFIYITTMLHYLKQTYTYEDFLSVLQSTPPDINALYRASLDRLEKSHTKSQCLWIREIFAWVTRPPRDVTVDQLRVGISESRRVRLHESPSPSAENIDITKILSACGAFLRLHSSTSVSSVTLSELGAPAPTSGKTTVSIVHSTFDAFIVSKSCPEGFRLNHYDTLHYRTLAMIGYLGGVKVERLDGIHISNQRREKWDKQFPLFAAASELWYSNLYYLGPGTFDTDRSTDILISRVLELAQAIVEFSQREKMTRWIRGALTYNESELDDLFNTVVAKAIRSVMLWMSNHEEFFSLKEAKRGEMAVVSRSRRHVIKYLEMVRQMHLERLEHNQVANNDSDNHAETSNKPNGKETTTAGTSKAKVRTTVVEIPTKNSPPKISPPTFHFSLSLRRRFRTSNSTRYKLHLTKILAETWLATEAKYNSHSMACFFELSMLYQSTTAPGSADGEVAEGLPHSGDVDFVKAVKEWALPSTDSGDAGHCANVNIAHAYNWYYGSKEPGNPRDIRLAIEHYNLALKDKRIHFTGDILQSLSRASKQLFFETLQDNDLMDSIKFAEQAVQNTPLEDPLKGRYTAELCDLLGLRANWMGTIEDIEKAVDLARKGLEVGDVWQVPGIRGNLMSALIDNLIKNYEMTGKTESVNEAFSVFGRALHFLDSPTAEKQFGKLKKLYTSAGETGLRLPVPPFTPSTLSGDVDLEDPPTVPPLPEEDSFQPFFDSLTSIQEAYFQDLQAFMSLFFDPDLLATFYSLDNLLAALILHYHTSKMSLLALQHCTEVLNFTNAVVEWFKKLLPAEEDIQQWQAYLEFMAERAELNLTMGDVLMNLGREAEADKVYDDAVRDLRTGKENVYRQKTIRGLRRGVWMFKGSRFTQKYLPKVEKEQKDKKDGKEDGTGQTPVV